MSSTESFQLVDYSEKSIALFGDTKPLKEQLKKLGGRYNGYLTWEGQKRPGWIFGKKRREEVEKLLSGDLPDSSELKFALVLVSTGNLNSQTLKSLGGTFNASLSFDGTKTSGWIFPYEKLDEIKNAKNLPEE